MRRFHPANQGVGEHTGLLGITAFQPHQLRQGGAGTSALIGGQGLPGHPPQGVVTRHTAGAIDASQAHEYR